MSEAATGGLLSFFTRTPLALWAHVLRKPHDDSEAATAWAIFQFNWGVMAGLWLLFGLCLILTDFRVEPIGYLIVLSTSALYGYIGYLNARSAQRAKPWIFSLLTGIAQTTLASIVLASLSYVATAANLPLQDANLLALDRALGFDFREYLSFANDRPWLVMILAFGYRAISLTACIIIVALPLFGHYRRLAEFNLAISLALALTCGITLLIPAVGVYHVLGLLPSDYPNIVPQAFYDSARDMLLVRDGTLRLLDTNHLAGIVTFPSFHAAAAVLDGWALWSFRWLRPFNVMIHGAMLLSTPIGGGHFLVDMIAGISIAILSILVARLVALRLRERDGRFAAQSHCIPAAREAWVTAHR
ncbi:MULTISPECIES: phosphatase PAP2 family protein [unclassified Bradyrhizobium]|uniref:phosphatase PAP2 family protein n=1 Tax=unclassified Bradyrhizobium TaxID=2631580 RepID=UPI002916C549|nr:MULTISPECIES: phosphatase PAP2 family protein [unclassified Bradyrhizobium]